MLRVTTMDGDTFAVLGINKNEKGEEVLNLSLNIGNFADQTELTKDEAIELASLLLQNATKMQ